MNDSTRKQTQPIPNFQNLVLQSSRFSLHVLLLSTTLVDEIFRYETSWNYEAFEVWICVWLCDPELWGKNPVTWQNSLGRFKEWEQFLLFLSTRIKVLLAFLFVCVCFLYSLFVSKLWMFLNWKHKKWRLVQGSFSTAGRTCRHETRRTFHQLLVSWNTLHSLYQSVDFLRDFRISVWPR